MSMFSWKNSLLNIATFSYFGYIPYSNSSRKGRLVWFTEDYDKLDKE